MLKNPEDRRARRSRRLVKESLLALMKEKNFAEISVRDVTDAADMNRGTFYLHYAGTVEHREVCAVLFTSSEASGFFQAIQRLVHKNGTPLVRAWFSPADPRQTDYLLNFLAWGFIGLLAEWFEKDMALPKAELLAAAQRMAEGAAGRLFSQERRES